MATRTRLFSAAEVRELRSALSKATPYPYAPNDNPPQGVHKSGADPTRVADGLRRLSLKPGLVLRAYLVNDYLGGNGYVYALPEDVPLPDPPDDMLGHRSQMREQLRPAVALPHVMDAFAGDGSPVSFMEASMLVREIQEFGAWWHGVAWHTHSIVEANPVPPEPELTPVQSWLSGLEWWGGPRGRQWDWRAPPPKDWRPSVAIEDSGVARVSFLTCTAGEYTDFIRGIIYYYQHVDTYETGTLRPRTSREAVLVA